MPSPAKPVSSASSLRRLVFQVSVVPLIVAVLLVLYGAWHVATLQEAFDDLDRRRQGDVRNMVSIDRQVARLAVLGPGLAAARSEIERGNELLVVQDQFTTLYRDIEMIITLTGATEDWQAVRVAGRQLENSFRDLNDLVREKLDVSGRLISRRETMVTMANRLATAIPTSLVGAPLAWGEAIRRSVVTVLVSQGADHPVALQRALQQFRRDIETALAVEQPMPPILAMLTNELRSQMDGPDGAFTLRIRLADLDRLIQGRIAQIRLDGESLSRVSSQALTNGRMKLQADSDAVRDRLLRWRRVLPGLLMAMVLVLSATVGVLVLAIRRHLVRLRDRALSLTTDLDLAEAQGAGQPVGRWDPLAGTEAALGRVAAAIHLRDRGQRDLEDRHQVIIDMMSDAVMVIDLDSRRVVECNRAASILARWSPEQLLMMPTRALLEGLEEQLQGTRVGEGGGDVRLRCGDGSIRRCHLHGRQVSLAGKPCLVFVLRPVASLPEKNTRNNSNS